MFNDLLKPLIFHLKATPSVFLPIARRRTDSKKRVVSRDTEIVIEGFWRCGNHFATWAFIQAQRNPTRVAHHFHAPAQLMLAARWGIPAILLIRNPLDAVASSAIYLRRDPQLILHLYGIFHRSLVPYVDRLVVSDFDETVGDIGGVIERVNRRFGCCFDVFDGSDEARAQVERGIREEHEKHMRADPSRLPLPSAEKERQKQAVIDRIQEPACARLFHRATEAYEALRAEAGTHKALSEFTA